METKTLSELAALAAKHVPGFKRPMKEPWGIRNDTPEALFMAVMLYALEVDDRASTVEIDNAELPFLRINNSNRSGSALVDPTPETIARGALVALLELHGVTTQ